MAALPSNQTAVTRAMAHSARVDTDVDASPTDEPNLSRGGSQGSDVGDVAGEEEASEQNERGSACPAEPEETAFTITGEAAGNTRARTQTDHFRDERNERHVAPQGQAGIDADINYSLWDWRIDEPTENQGDCNMEVDQVCMLEDGTAFVIDGVPLESEPQDTTDAWFTNTEQRKTLSAHWIG